jgi:hypothetical protein
VRVYSSLIGVVGWAVGVVAVVQFLRKRNDSGLFYLIFSAGLITVIGGLGDLSTLTSSQLVTSLPAVVTRAAVAIKIGLGLGLALGGLLRLRSSGRTARPEPEPAEAEAEAVGESG